MPALRSALGFVIRRRRQNAGYSQDRFADAVGFHRTYIGALERGEVNLSLSTLERVASALGISPSVLLVEAENAQRSQEPG